MKEKSGLKKWEIALLLALCITLCFGWFGETDCCAWWGTIYPELNSAGAYAQTAAGTGEGVMIRFRIAEWIMAWLARLR